MKNSIAVISGEGGLPASVSDGTRALVYELAGGRWETRESIEYSPDFKSAGVLRDSLRSLISRLGDCRIVAAREMPGIAYHVFDRMGFAIFEIGEISDGVLSGILADVGERATEAGKEEKPPAFPVPKNGEGRYFIDLIELQASRPEVSSKMALRGFLKTRFEELEIICSHEPPWLEAELDKKLTLTREEAGERRVRLSIRRV
ncbi:MAG: hypothetical protein LBD49_01480 [Oscillospiraceae bacterium]|jgi:Fe-only nitrogenase accessory protein AnfO|nr:hypothetical protein [Oscillospiraceae bacterium]